MPKQRRWTIKRECDFTLRYLDKAMARLFRLHNAYKDHHPDVAHNLYQLRLVILSVQEAIQVLRDAI